MNSLLEEDDASLCLNNSFDILDRVNSESEYVQQNINAFRLIRAREYLKASEAYKTCLAIATKLGNNYKIKDSLCNYGISLFYTGNFDEAVSNLETAFNKITNNETNTNDYLNNQLSIKIISNLIVCYLCLNQFNYALIMFNHLTNIISNYENEPNLQKNLIKNINYIFFRIESLTDVDSILDSISSDNHHNIIKRIIKSFHLYLKTNNIDEWIKCLQNEIDNLRIVQDYNGIIFALFNIQTGNFIKGCEIENKNLIQSSTIKFTELLKALNNNEENTTNYSNNNTYNSNKVNEYSQEDITKILNLTKEKMNIAIKIYKFLYDKEKSLNSINNNINSNKNINNTMDNSYINNNNNNNSLFSYCNNNKKNNTFFMNNNINEDSRLNNLKKNNGSKFFIKLLLKYALTYIQTNISNTGLARQLCSHIELTLKFLSNDELDLSYLNLNDLSPEIFTSIHTLFMNLINIYKKNKLSKYFNRLKYLNNKINKKYAEEQIKNLFENAYLGIKAGEILIKINYGNKETKNHYYLLNSKNESIDVFNNNKSDPAIQINQIIKILYGIRSNNLRKKIKTLPNNDQPYLFMSFLLRDRTYDLLFSEKSIKKWFYGLYYYLSKRNQNYKINSCSCFIIQRCKMKMNSLLNSNNHMRNQMRLQGGNKTFVKCLLMYHKMNKKINAK